MWPLITLSSALSAAFTLIALLLLKRWAGAWGLLDHPSGRKSHTHPTPVVGGLALAVGLTPLVFLAGLYSLPLMCWGITAGLLLVLGLIDDVIEMSSTQRLLAHLLAGFSLFPMGLMLSHLGLIWGDEILMLGWLSVPITLFAVAAAINAFNMIDGLDGLLALVCLTPLMVLASLASHAGMAWEAILAATLASGVGVFALFNVRFPWVSRASVFMGDAGSTVLGFSIAWLCISLAMQGAMPPVLALFLIMLPLMDTAGVIYRRVIRKVSAATPGHDHLHHLLLELGFGVRTTVLLMAAFNALFAFGGVLMWVLGVPDAVMLLVFVLVTVIYCVSSRFPARVKHWAHRR